MISCEVIPRFFRPVFQLLAGGLGSILDSWLGCFEWISFHHNIHFVFSSIKEFLGLLEAEPLKRGVIDLVDHVTLLKVPIPLCY